MTTPLLEATAVAKAFGPVVALRAVDLTVLPGEAHALLGANGAGKSTMVKILTGVLRADAGIDRPARPADRAAPAERRPGRRAGTGVPGPGADARSDRRPEPAPVRLGHRRRARRAGRHGSRRPRSRRAGPRPTAAVPAHARPRQGAGVRPATAGARRDHRGAAARPVRPGLRRDAAMEGTQPLGAVHLPPPGGGACPLRHVHRAPRRTRRGVVRARRGRRGADRVGDARRGGHGRPRRGTGACHGDRHGPAAGPRSRARRGRTAARRRVAGRRRPARCSGSSPSRVRGRRPSSTSSPATSSPTVDGCSSTASQSRRSHPFDVIRRGVVLVPADRLHALLPQRSIRENIAAPLFNRIAKWGPISGREERRRVQEAVDRLSIDTRAASQVRRLSGGNQQKVTIARWLRPWPARDAAVRPDAWHRRRHQAPGLRPRSRRSPTRGRRS